MCYKETHSLLIYQTSQMKTKMGTLSESHDDFDNQTVGELSIKSFFTRRRKWKHFSQILTETSGYLPQQIPTKIRIESNAISKDEYFVGFTAVFLDVDKRGNKRRSEKIMISSSNSGETFIYSCCKIPCPPDFILTNHCKSMKMSKQMKCYTAKKGLIKKKMVKKQRKEKVKEINDTKKRKKTNKNKTLIKQHNDKSLTEVNNNDNLKHEEYEETESDDSLEEKTHKRPYQKRLPKSMRYVFSDAYSEERHSKRKTRHLNCLLEDPILEPKRKSMGNHKTHKNNSFFDSIYDEQQDEENEYGIKSFSLPVLSEFFPDICNTCISDVQSPVVESPTSHDDRDEDMHLKKSSQILGSNAEDMNRGDVSGVMPEYQVSDELNDSSGKESNQTDSESPTTVSFNASELNVTTKKKQTDDTYVQRTKDAPSIILLSRSATRPDNLRRDFKLNYKEAHCKPRRFVINISHLAYQRFILNTQEPFHIIPELDLSMYLVFSFLKEVNDNADEFRVEVNTTWQFTKVEDILSPLCQGELVSVHEIMHIAIKALDSLDPCQVKKKENGNLIDVIDFLGLHSFNSLTSALKWKIQSMDYPHSLEWTGGLDDFAHLNLLLEPESKRHFNETFQCQAPLSNSVTLNHVRGVGPDKPYLCGKCLHDFTGNEKCSFPLALDCCRHWFCETCWKSSLPFHLDEIDQSSQLACLEEGCSSLIDPTSMLTLLPVQNVRDYQSWKWKTAIENIPQLKLCPNPSCRRIIFAKSPQESGSEFVNATCSCSYQMCFSCMSPPHWPVSCSIAKIYHRRRITLNHDTFNRPLKDEEFPDSVLKGKSCPKCGQIVPANCHATELKICSCGCVICWPCGEEVFENQRNLHTSCTQKFQIEDKQLKQRLKEHDRYWSKNEEMTRWYKVALRHRQQQHPQVVAILYKMAGHVAEAICEALGNGKYVGNVRQASSGWNSRFRKVAYKKIKFLPKNGKLDTEPESSNNIIDFYSENSPRPLSNLSFSESVFIGGQLSPTLQVQYDPALTKAICNIVDTKLELHHVIEHIAILLEYSHTLYQPGKVIRCLERAEDLCVCLDMLLQPSGVNGSSRIVPSFLRLRSQIISVLSTLACHLKENALYHGINKPS